MIERLMRAALLCLPVVFLWLHGAEAATSVVTAIPVYKLASYYTEHSGALSFVYIDDDLLTTSVQEMNNARYYGWKYLGIIFYVAPVQIPGSLPLYRLYSAAGTEHLYTADEVEKNAATAKGYVSEGILGYVIPQNSNLPGTVELHRFFYALSTVYGSRCHFHTTDPAGPTGTNQAWNYEGVICRVWTSNAALTSFDFTSPTKGETIKGGDKYDIAWNCSGKTGYVNLRYSTNAGYTWSSFTFQSKNMGYYSWTVPNIETQHARLKAEWVTYSSSGSSAVVTLLAQSELEYDFTIKKQPEKIPIVPIKTTVKAPTALTAKPVTIIEIDLNWKAGSGASSGADPTGYRIERKMGNNAFSLIAYAKSDQTFYQDKSLVPGTTYTYRVQGFKDLVESAYSNEATAKTPTAHFDYLKVPAKTKK